MTAKVEVCCQWCDSKFTARVADRKRGWGRFCSKACKASKQKYGATKAFWEKVNPSHKRSNINKYADRVYGGSSDEEFDEIMSGISDMDYGASDGGGYESI